MNRRRTISAASKQTKTTTTTTGQQPLDYSTLIRAATSFNSKLVADRTSRLPFVDNQTGVAQRNCALWRSARDRYRGQEEEPSNGGHRGRQSVLYSYPSQHWLKRRQQQQQPPILPQPPTINAHDDQLRRLHQRAGEQLVFSAALSYSSPSSSSSSSSSSSPSSRLALIGLNAGRTKQPATLVGVHVQQQRPPPRADSTGSHSFADSDSRDHSSQSVGSPRSQQLDDEHQQQQQQVLDGDDGRLAARDDTDEQIGLSDHHLGPADCEPKEGKLGEPHGNNISITSSFKRSASSLLATRTTITTTNVNTTQTNNGRKTAQNNNRTIIKTTKATNRKRAASTAPELDVGSEEFNNNNNTDSQKEPEASEAGHESALLATDGLFDDVSRYLRPYVCPICDQTYKTRPGLSYHFVHAHDTVLPRGLPVKINQAIGEQAVKRTNKTSDGNSWSGAKRRRRSRTKKLNQSKTKRVLRQSEQDEPVAMEQVAESSPRDSFVEQSNGMHDLHDQDHEGQNCDQLVQELTSEDTELVEMSVGASAIQAQKEFQETEPAIEQLAQATSSDPASSSTTTSIVGDGSPKVDSPLREEPDKACSGSTEEVKDDPLDAAQTTTTTAAATVDELSVPLSRHQDDHDLKEPKPGCKQNLFCDFCLGTVDKNRRTRLPEELISCSSCGSSGHPSCLRFSDNIRRSVQKYQWQCLECKTCSTCNQADHEDQLLFCDDCDRSYHTYCLSPQLDHPPEGNWTCKPCLSEYYTTDRDVLTTN